MTAAGTVATPVEIREVEERRDLEAFISLPWKINAADPNWVPPLRSSVRHALDPRRHPFHQHAEVATFLALHRGEVVGRIAAVVNHLHNEYHEERTGFFGLFEAIDDRAVASALLERATEWVRERGMDRIRGPLNLSTNEEISSPGLLVDGFDTAPMAMMSHNPPYYEGLIEASGFQRSRDLLAYWLDDTTPPERLVRGMDRVLDRMDARVRPLDLRRFREEVDIIKSIYNSAWSRNWGFVPMTDAEFDHMAREFRPIVDPALCLIAEVKGEPVGFSLGLPNINQALRHLPDGRLFPLGLFRFLWHRRSIRGIRVITLGFRPGYQQSGLGAALYLRTWLDGVTRGYDHGEASWILEENLDMVRPLERMGGRAYRRYRIYEREW